MRVGRRVRRGRLGRWRPACRSIKPLLNSYRPHQPPSPTPHSKTAKVSFTTVCVCGVQRGCSHARSWDELRAGQVRPMSNANSKIDAALPTCCCHTNAQRHTTMHADSSGYADAPFLGLVHRTHPPPTLRTNKNYRAASTEGAVQVKSSTLPTHNSNHEQQREHATHRGVQADAGSLWGEFVKGRRRAGMWG